MLFFKGQVKKKVRLLSEHIDGINNVPVRQNYLTDASLVDFLKELQLSLLINKLQLLKIFCLNRNKGFISERGFHIRDTLKICPRLTYCLPLWSFFCGLKVFSIFSLVNYKQI